MKFLGLTYTGIPNLTDSPESLVGSTKDKIVWNKELQQNVVRYGSKLPFDKQGMVEDYEESHNGDLPFQTKVEDYPDLEPYLEKLSSVRAKLIPPKEVSKEPIEVPTEAILRELAPTLPEDLRLGVIYNAVSKDQKEEFSIKLIEFFKRCLYHLYVKELSLPRYICLNEEASLPPSLRFGCHQPYNLENYQELASKYGHMELLHVLFESLWNTYILTGTEPYPQPSARLISLKTALLFSTLGSVPTLHSKELTFFKNGWLNRTDKFTLDNSSLGKSFTPQISQSEGVMELHEELMIRLIPKALIKLLRPILTPKSGFTFTWELMLDSGLFGFIQSRLYGGAWNSTFPQDFNIKYSPRSWMWYKQILLKSPFTVLVYGKEDLHGEFEKLGYPEFKKILLEQDKNQGRSSSLTFGEKLRVKAISIRNYKEKNIPLSGKVASMQALPELTVFNSPSLAFSSLVSLFSNANKFEEYIETYETHHEVTLNSKSKRILKSYLSLGYADKLLFLTPELLPELPNFGKFDADFEYLKEEVQALSLTKDGGEALIPKEIIEGYDASPGLAEHSFPGRFPAFPLSLLKNLANVRNKVAKAQSQSVMSISPKGKFTSLPPIVSSAK